MSKVTSVKRILFLVVALLLCATVVFVACSDDNFTPLSEKPSGHTPESNGGIAVRYGEWLYYINGYTADTTADNTYSDDVKTNPRIGSVVRIKFDDIEKLFALHEEDDDLSKSERAEKVADAVRGGVEGITGAQTVVPRIYISNMTEEAAIDRVAGLYILNDRIYITTPNDELTASGNPKTNELVLMSYALDGSDETRHFKFTDSSVQIVLEKVGDKVFATYYTDSKLYTLDIASGTETLIAYENADDYDIDTINDVSSVKWDVAGKYVFFINSVGDICRLKFGTTEYEVMVANSIKNVKHGSIETDHTFTIINVNNGQVYYTKVDEEEKGSFTYWADGTNSAEFNVALHGKKEQAIGWKDGKLIDPSYKVGDYYGIRVISEDGSEEIEELVVLYPQYNDQTSLSNVSVQGDTLYYTSKSISYRLDLNKVVDDDEKGETDKTYKGEAYALDLSSGSGWAKPDFLFGVTVQNDDGEDVVVNYVFTLSTSSITVVKFNPEDKTNSEVTITLTLVAA